MNSHSVTGLTAFYGTQRGYEIGKWDRLVNTNFSIYWAQDIESSSDVKMFNKLTDEGIKINYLLRWSHDEEFEGVNVVDLYLDSFELAKLINLIDSKLEKFDVEKLWAITISEGEPWNSIGSFWDSNILKQYNDTFKSDTGYWLKDARNRTEDAKLHDWLGEKIVWLFNHIYDYLKGKWSHLVIFQNINLP
ncbi:MAG: hypothetical protein ACXAD7_08385 [Candidatus Kariarchaeaceae archaeon]|jgi:hypothetical protein